MIRLQTQLSEYQLERLREIARSEGVSVAELLRQGADLVIRRRSSAKEAYLRRFMKEVDTFASGLADVAEQHDKYLDEAYDDRVR